MMDALKGDVSRKLLVALGFFALATLGAAAADEKYSTGDAESWARKPYPHVVINQLLRDVMLVV
ncbi:hypothetical protein [Ensifer adhaerens]